MTKIDVFFIYIYILYFTKNLLFCFENLSKKSYSSIKIHIPGQACFAVSRLISWASVGLELRTLRFQVRCYTYCINRPQSSYCHTSPECSMPEKFVWHNYDLCY